MADEVLGFIVSFSFEGTGETGLRNKGEQNFLFFLSAPSPVTCNSPDVTWWQRWDFDLGLTVMQKNGEFFLGKEPTSGQHPPLRKKGKSPYLGHPIL